MRGGQRRLVRPPRSPHLLGRAHGVLLRLPCFLLHPSLSPSFSSQGWCPPPRLRGPGRLTEVPPASHQPRPLAHVRAPKVQRWVQIQVHQVLALLVPQAPSSRRCLPSLCSYLSFLLMTDLHALDVRQGVAAGTQRRSASATRRFYSVFSTVFLLCLPCCLLLV